MIWLAVNSTDIDSRKGARHAKVFFVKPYYLFVFFVAFAPLREIIVFIG